MDHSSEQQPLGFTFSETMAGYIASGDLDFERAAEDGRTLNDTLAFHVTILVDDLQAFLDDPDHTARLEGTVEAPRFGGTATIENGVFNLFAPEATGGMQMRYRMSFPGADDRRYRLEGFKAVRNDEMIDFWTDTTKLFTTVRHENGADEPIVATGILRIRALDLIPQVLSMHALHGQGILSHVEALSKFGLFFSEKMLSEYGDPRKLAFLRGHGSQQSS